MEVFVDFIFDFLEFFVLIHLFFLFFSHEEVFALGHLFVSKRPFYEAKYVLGDDCLHLEWKVLFYVIVGSSNYTEIIVGREANRLNLLQKVLFGLNELLRL